MVAHCQPPILGALSSVVPMRLRHSPIESHVSSRAIYPPIIPSSARAAAVSMPAMKMPKNVPHTEPANRPTKNIIIQSPPCGVWRGSRRIRNPRATPQKEERVAHPESGAAPHPQNYRPAYQPPCASSCATCAPAGISTKSLGLTTPRKISALLPATSA